jgi:hypothetical protein
MTNIPRTQATDGVPTYLGRGDPEAGSRTTTQRGSRSWPATPPWRDRCSTAQCRRGRRPRRHRRRPRAIRPSGLQLRRPWGDNSFIEDYTAEVRGAPVGAVHLITFNADGKAQHIIVNYRPLSSVMFFSRLLREKFAGTPYAEHYLAGEV